MNKEELLSLLRNNLSITIRKEHIEDYGAGGRPYSDDRLVVRLMLDGEQIDKDYISLSHLKIE